MSNVRAFHNGINVPTKEPNQALISALRSLLDSAETGQLQSFIGTGFGCDGLRNTLWCDHHDNIYEQLGSIEWLKQEYIRAHS